MSILNILNKSKKKEIILPALTWSSDIYSVLQNQFKPVFVDINLNNLSMDLSQVKRKINKNTLAVFITHAQGFNGLTKEFISYLKKKKIHLIEDYASHMELIFKSKRKLGTYGLIFKFFILLCPSYVNYRRRDDLYQR